MQMLSFTVEHLRARAQAVLEAAGAPADLAQLVGHALVDANLMGHDSHGVIRLIEYTKLVHTGQIKPAARPTVLDAEGADSATAAVAHVDGAWGWGQAAAQLATSVAIERAGRFGLAAVTISHCNHVGRLGEYPERMARAGLIGIALCNAGASVTPFGGMKRLLGTNPIAMGLPRPGQQDPILVDLATAAVAEGKLRVARVKGEAVAPGLILDKHGQPSQDPQAFYDDGFILPFGGHKGYSLSVMVELLGGALSGAGPSSSAAFHGGNGVFMLALNIPAFLPPEQFESFVQELCANILSAPPAPGQGAVLLPGDPEWAARRQRQAHGIELPEATWGAIEALGKDIQATETETHSVERP